MERNAMRMVCPLDSGYTHRYRLSERQRDMQVCPENIRSPSSIGIDTEKLSDGTVIATFSQTDTYGTPFPYGDNRIYISLTGNAKVISFENGNPIDTECNAGALSRRTFFGLARAFIKTGDKNAGMIAAAISGDRTLKTSHKVSVPAYRIALAGQTRQSSENLTVRYTTDGSTPETGSPEYTVPFDVSSGTTVKANVYYNGKAVLYMEETFGDGNGLYWGSPGEPVCKSSGLQAEYAELSNASIHNNDGDDVYGGGYVLIKSTGGSITWYQENDGSDMDARLRIRYSHNNGNSLYMEIKNNGQSTGILEFKDTGSRAGDWEYLEIPIKLYSGANNISLISHDTASPSIDELQIITH